jgi:hypothetical protein
MGDLTTLPMATLVALLVAVLLGAAVRNTRSRW